MWRKRRLTAVGWIAVIVILLVAFAVVMKLIQVGGSLLGVRALPKVDVPMPTAVSGPPIPTPVPWLSRMQKVAGVWKVPSDVEQTVRQHYLEALNWQFPVSPTFNIDLVMSQAPTYLTGEYLDNTLNWLDSVKRHPDRQNLVTIPVHELSPNVTVSECSSDGTTCIVEAEFADPVPFDGYDYMSRTWLGRGLTAPFVERLQMRFVNGRWKIAKSISLEVLDKELPPVVIVTPTPSPVVTPTRIPLP